MSTGVGVIASGRAASGGGATASIPEFQSNVHNSNATTSFSIATTLLSSDLVLVMARSSASLDAVTISGGTLSLFHWYRSGGSSGPRLYIYAGTGITGSQSVTFDPSSTSSTNTVGIYVVRGLTSPGITSSSESTFYSIDGVVGGSETNTTTEQTPSTTIGVGQVAIFAALFSTGSGNTFPSSITPASGWTTNQTGVVSLASYVGASAGTTVQGEVSSSTSNQKGVMMLTLG